MTRDSVWWRAHFQGHLMTDSDCLQLINQIAAEEKAHAITLEALAESEKRATLFAEELEHDNSDYCKRADKAEGELSRLRANFDRIVTAWKREELSWDEERKDLNRDVKQLHDAAVETEGKLERVRGYMRHEDTCMRRQIGTVSGDPDCTCGLDALLAQIGGKP